MKCQPGLQSLLRFGISYKAVVGQIQLLVVVGLKFYFLAGVSGVNYTAISQHTFYEDSDLRNAT